MNCAYGVVTRQAVSPLSHSAYRFSQLVGWLISLFTEH